MSARTTGRTLEEFRQAHDPTYEVMNPSAVFDQQWSKDTRRFIITAAQNATPVHAAFWGALRTAASHLGAQLLVIPLRYKNPTSQWTGSQRNAEHWDPAVREYLFNQRRKLNANITLAADVKTQPTAGRPLTGFDALTGHESMVIGHTKLQMLTVASPASKLPKIMTTTGACTMPNYTDSKQGKIGEFHHTLGAVLVEIKGNKFHLRHLNADKETGAFSDLNTMYGDGGIVSNIPVAALVMGDTHVGFVDPGVERATFGPGGMVETLKPAHLIWHDLLDGYSVNPHHSGNPFNAIAKKASGWDKVRDEVERAVGYVVSRTPKNATSIVVGSNHDDFLRRWVLGTDWREDPGNATFYLETALAMARATCMGDSGAAYPSPFVYWMEQATAKQKNIRCLHGDESFKLVDVELGMHGDRGPNGARGSVRNLRRIGVKSIIGHSHSPAIDEGCYQVGTSTRLRLEYNHGPSAWLNTHCILHMDGKRQLITIVDGEWHL